MTYNHTPDLLAPAIERAFDRLNALPNAGEAACILDLLADLNVIRA